MNPEESTPKPASIPASGAPADPTLASHLKQIRTFQGDIAEALHGQNESLVSIQRTEQARREAHAIFSKPRATEPAQPQQAVPEQLAPQITREEIIPPTEAPRPTSGQIPVIMAPARKAPPPRPEPMMMSEGESLASPEELAAAASRKKGALLSIGILFLFGAGGAGAWYAYKGYEEKTAVPVTTVVANQFFQSQSTLNVDATSLNRDTLGAVIRTAQENTSLTDGSVEQIELRDGASSTAPFTDTQELLTLLNSQAPGKLVRAFDPLFMMGIIGSTTPDTFIVIKLDSFDNAFPGMLDWEPTMGNELLPLFASNETIQNVPAGAQFEDITIDNVDARILKDSNGQTVLLYAFYDDSMLIITDNENGLRNIIAKLNAQKLAH